MVVALGGLTLAARAQQGGVTLAWDPAPGGTAASYNVYYGTTSGAYTSKVSVSTGQANITGLQAGALYFFAVTEVDSVGVESGFSAEISYQVPLGLPTLQVSGGGAVPGSLRLNGLPGHIYDILASQDFKVWKAIGTVTTGANGSASFSDPVAGSYRARFYRLHEVTYTPAGSLPVLNLVGTMTGADLLQITGQIGHSYNVLRAKGFGGWTLIGTVTIPLGTGGTVEFVAPTGLLSSHVYQLQETF